MTTTISTQGRLGTEQGDVRDAGVTTSPARHHVPGFRTLVGDPRVGRLLLSDAISGSADAMYWIALIVVLARQPGASGWIAAAIVARLTPRLLFGAVGGTIADRFDRRRLLLLLDASRAVLMAALTVVVAVDGPPILAVSTVFLVCALGTPYRPTVSASLPHLVDEHALGRTNAMWSAVGHLINLLGPIAGIALLAAGPVWLPFAANTASFVGSVLLVLGIDGLGRAAIGPDRRGALADLADGVGAIRRDVGLLALTAIVGVGMLLRGFELVLHVRVAVERLGLGAAGYGWISAAIAVGALAASPFVSRAGLPTHPGRMLLVTSLVGCLSLALLALVDRVWVALVVVAIEGAGIVAFEVAAITLMQLVTPRDLLGRVSGIQNAVSGSGKLAGALLAPLFLSAFGLRPALVLVAVVVAGSVLLTARHLLTLAPAARATVERIAPVVQTLQAISVFEGVPGTALQALALRARRETVPAGAVITREGDPADDFFVVGQGALSVSTAGVEINRLGADDWFGEIGLVQRSARTATVTATSECVLWRIPGDAFLDAVTSTGTLPDPLVSGMADRIARSDRVRPH